MIGIFFLNEREQRSFCEDWVLGIRFWVCCRDVIAEQEQMVRVKLCFLHPNTQAPKPNTQHKYNLNY